MSDDSKNNQSGGGFDDWLDDEPGPVTDPYQVSAAEPETSDRPDADPHLISDENVDSEDATGEIEHVVVDEADETSEIEPVSLDDDGDTSETDADHDDTGELEILAPESEDDDALRVEDANHEVEDANHEVEDANHEVEDANHEVEDANHEVEDANQKVDVGNAWEVTEGSDDTDELEPVASIGFGDLWSEDDSEEPESSGTSSELFDMSNDDYPQTATKEHAGLAASVARADDEDTEQVALAAPMPGLESGVVGFDDVVEAEGMGRARARGSGDLIARIITGIVLVVALGASMMWRPAFVLFVLGVFVLGAGEFYTALVRSGRKPIALFGFIGIIGASLGAFFGGALWIPLAFLLAVTLLLLFYAVVPGKVDPMANLALTISVMVWAGLGSFAMLIARSDDYRILVLGVVAAVAAMDIAQYFFGRALGRHQLAPWVSPKKTVEGLVAGVIVALTVGALLHFLQPFELTSGLAIGAAVAVFAPIGDLAMSAAKRSLGMKDMGSVLPGHGGFMDRIDGLLFAIPVAWAIFVWAGLL